MPSARESAKEPRRSVRDLPSDARSGLTSRPGPAPPASSSIPDDSPTGHLTLCDARTGTKKMEKRFFVLTGMQLRWYETKDAFIQRHTKIGEITCCDFQAGGKHIICLRDARGKSDLTVRTDLGCDARHAVPTRGRRTSLLAATSLAPLHSGLTSLLSSTPLSSPPLTSSHLCSSHLSCCLSSCAPPLRASPRTAPLAAR